MAKTTRPFAVEHRSIDFIPPGERHGSVFNLFTLWFSTNMQITTVVTGALAVILGLPLLWALIAIVVGNVLGGIFMALHSAQGPRLGIPQMIQSRAQFGFFGATVPLVLVILMYIGYFASSAVLGGQALSAWIGIPVTPAIIFVSLICTVLAIYGYDLIHRYEKYASILFALGFLFLTIRLLSLHSMRAAFSGHTSFSGGTFLLVVSVVATWQLTFAPYVADYSRYLPEDTSISASFWWTYAGSVLGTIWMMAFGCIAFVIAGNQFENNPVQYVVLQGGVHLSSVIYILILLGIIGANVLNLYGVFMSATTTITVLQQFRVGVRVRILFVLVAAIIGTLVAVLGQGNFIENYTNFLLLLLYFLIPWTAINLVDFYWLRHEEYDIAAIFDPNGVYGRFNWRAIVTYVVTIVVELPFMSTTLYTGPLVSHLGGADIAWIVGLVVSSVVYYVLMRGQISTPAIVDEPQTSTVEVGQDR